MKAEFKQVAICCWLFRTNWLNLQFYSQWGEPCLTTHFLLCGQIQRIGLRYFSESLFSFGNDSLGGSKKQLCLAQDCPKCPFSYFIIGNGRARESNCRQNVDSSWHAFDSSRKGALSILLGPCLSPNAPCVSKAWPWSAFFFFFWSIVFQTLLAIWF